MKWYMTTNIFGKNNILPEYLDKLSEARIPADNIKVVCSGDDYYKVLYLSDKQIPFKYDKIENNEERMV